MPAETACAPPLSDAVHTLWLPPLALAGCVRAGMRRDTRAVSLAPEQRFNHFPATPLCSLCWWFSGESQLLAPGAPAALESPRIATWSGVMWAGPQTQPGISWNPGPGHGAMLMLPPDAVHQLIGRDPSADLDRLCPAAEVLPPDWLAMADEVMRIGRTLSPGQDESEAVQQLFAPAVQLLLPRWQALRDAPAAPAAPARRYGDWAEHIALRAATSSAARSLRQMERRIKQWTGQPLRELRVVGRAEQAFFDVLEAQAQGRVDWPDIAQRNGYADQSHLCRVTRRLTGFSPAELQRRIETDEGFWAYRLWQ